MKNCDYINHVGEYFDERDGAGIPLDMKSHLRKCPACGTYYGNLRIYKKKMEALNDDIAAPERLKDFALALTAGGVAAPPRGKVKPRGFVTYRRLAAAAVILVLFGAAFVYRAVFLQQGCEGSFFADYNKFMIMADKYGVRTGKTEEITAWFSDRLDYRVTPPRVYGYILTGGRKCHLLDRDLAVLFYEREGHLVSLFILRADDLNWKYEKRKTNSGRTVIAGSEDGNSLMAWREDRLTYVAVSDVSDDELKRLFFND